MHRLMLWYLAFLYIVSVVLSFFKLLPFDPFQILFTGIYFSFISYISNQIIGFLLKMKPKIEPQFITALILTFIIGPIPFLPNILFLTLVPVLAMASKYLIIFDKKHIFNPAALAVTVSALVLGKNASWWIGNSLMVPFIVIGGLYVLWKIRRFNMVLIFLLMFFLFILVTNFKNLFPFTAGVSNILSSLSPLLFFGIVMLTEPMTSPADYKLRAYYGIACAVITILLQRFTSIPYTIELSLLITNILGRIVTQLKTSPVTSL